MEHKGALEQHLAARWKDLFNASFDIVLYDLTSTYFEGSADAIPKARRGCSRDHRPDCKQLVIALIVTPEGFPLTYEIFSGDTVDVTTLKTICEQVESKHGAARRVWVFDRGITSEENLAWLRERGAHYLVGTPKPKLRDFEQHLTDADWTRASGEVDVKLCPDSQETYVPFGGLRALSLSKRLCRSTGRVEKEHAMRRRALRAFVRDLIKLRRQVARGRLTDTRSIEQRMAWLEERHRPMRRFLTRYELRDGRVQWEWDRKKWRAAVARDGAYLLRAHPFGRLRALRLARPERSRRALGDLHPAHRSGGGVPHLEKRNQSAPDLALERNARGSAHPGRVPGLRDVGVP